MSAAYIPAPEPRYRPGSQGLQRDRFVPWAAAQPSCIWLAAIGLLLAVLLAWANFAFGTPDADGAATNDWISLPVAVLVTQRLLLLRRS